MCGGIGQSFNILIFSIVLELFMLYLFPIDGELLKEELMSHLSFVAWVSHGDGT